jgi:MinD-like ATPase involved in chromosome partitioning or flagellar assembly
MRLGIAMPGHLAAIIAVEAVRHGHDLVFEVSTRVALDLALDELAQRGRAPDLIIVAGTAALLDEALLARADRAGVRIVPVAIDRRDRSADRLGLPAVPAGADWASIEAMITGATVSTSATDRGSTVVVWGADGAPGRTTIAIALAAALAAEEHGVVLVDADARAASIAIALGLLDESPGVAAACRLAAAGALDPEELTRLSAPLPGADRHARVITGIVRADRWPELADARLRGVLDGCRRWRELTVVDVAASAERDDELVTDERAPRRAAATLAALDDADVVVLVGAADPVGIARMIEAAATMTSITTAHVVPVVNRMRSGAIGGIDPRRQLISTLDRFGGIADPVLIPIDQAGADRALRTGLPLPVAAPRSAATAAARRLARTILQVLGAPAGASAAPR